MVYLIHGPLLSAVRSPWKGWPEGNKKGTATNEKQVGELFFEAFIKLLLRVLKPNKPKLKQV